MKVFDKDDFDVLKVDFKIQGLSSEEAKRKVTSQLRQTGEQVSVQGCEEPKRTESDLKKSQICPIRGQSDPI